MHETPLKIEEKKTLKVSKKAWVKPHSRAKSIRLHIKVYFNSYAIENH